MASISKRILLKAKYIILNSKSYIENGYVVISDGVIEEVGRQDRLPQGEFEVHEFGDSIISPGFINTHTHAAMVGMRGMADDLPLKTWLEKYIWPTELKLVNREFISKTIPLAIAEMVSSGITTFVDMYFYQDLTAEIVKKVGMRAVLGEGLIDGPTPAFENPDKVLQFTESFIKDYEKDPFIIPAVAPHAPYSTGKETLLKSKELSDKYGVPLLIHVAETKWEFDEIASRFGLTPFAYLDKIGFLSEKVIAAHSVWIDENEFDIIKKKEVNVSHNPESNAKLASGIAPIPEFLKKEINVTIGTDGACSNNNLDIVEEMRTASLLQKVRTMNPEALTAREVFKMATENGAKAIGLGDELGTLESGKWADIAIFSLRNPNMNPIFDPYSHIVYAAKGSDICATMVHGKFLYYKGEFTTLDYERAIQEIKALESKIVKEIIHGN